MAGALRRFLLRLALEEAIRREEKAYRFYESALEAVQDPQAVGLLRRLSAEELRHRLKLEDLQRAGELAQTGEVAAEAELTELPADPGPEWPAAAGELEPQDVWAIALRKERQARDYYRFLALRAAVASFREVFAYLGVEEQRHVEWVQAALQAAEGAGS